MKLKYFEPGKVEGGYGPEGITLEDQVFSISKRDGLIAFFEECDGYFSVEYTKEEAVEMLQEAIAWIKQQ